MKNYILYITLIVALLCSCTDMPDEFRWSVKDIRVSDVYKSNDPKHVSVTFNLSAKFDTSAEEGPTEAYLIVGDYENGNRINIGNFNHPGDDITWYVPNISLELPYTNYAESDQNIFIYLASPHCCFDNNRSPILKVKVPSIRELVSFSCQEMTEVTSTSARINILYKNPTQVAWEENEFFTVDLGYYRYGYYDYYINYNRTIKIPFPKDVQERSECVLSTVIDGLEPDHDYRVRIKWNNKDYHKDFNTNK